jgi:hypothetical protein
MIDRVSTDVSKFRKVKWFAGFALGAVALVGVVASLSANAGLCLQNGRHLQDIDFFKSAIDIVIHDPVDGVVEYIPGAVIAKTVHSQKYASSDEFLLENPDCCGFVPANSGDGGPDISVLDMIKGMRVVEVSYAKRYLDDGQSKTTEVKGKVAVTSCGKGLSYR